MPSPREPSGPDLARQVAEKGIRDPRVLLALSKVPRDRFLPPETRDLARADQAVEIGLDQTISQPFMVAAMTLELNLSGKERVLEIGTGSGYQTAVLAQRAAEIFTIERFTELSLRARGILDGLALTDNCYRNIHYRIGDGSLGWPEEAPFDRVLVTAAAPAFPKTLFQQLADGGLMVVPIGGDELQQLTVVRKVKGEPTPRQVMSCRFVPLVGEEGWKEA